MRWRRDMGSRSNPSFEIMRRRASADEYGDRAGTPQATVAGSRNVDTGTLPEFGTGLRLALQRRGTLSRPRALFSTLALLVRDEEKRSDATGTAPLRRHVLRLAA